MELGTNEEEFVDELDDFEGQLEDSPTEEGSIEGSSTEDPPIEEDFVASLLRSRGIEDKSRVKFETEDGNIEEVDWDQLSNDDKLNIINSSNESIEDGLDDSEKQILSAIRNSGMTPAEYLQYVEQQGVNRYIQNNQENTYQYTVDQYDDDELFVADFISRMGDVTDEEAQEALERAKSNETLFAKQIQAIRNEYKQIEEENIRQAQIEQEQQQSAMFDQFASSVENEINQFNEIQGYDLNMDQQDMQDLYDFITGTDAAGNNYLAKALSDPRILVETAWFTLYGKQMLDDVTNYFQKEITQVRKQSYEKGLKDAKLENKSSVVYKQKNKTSEEYADLDDF